MKRSNFLNKAIFKINPNFQFSIIGSFVIGFGIYFVFGLLLRLEAWVYISMISIVLVLFWDASLYTTYLFKDYIMCVYVFGLIRKTEIIENILVKKVSFVKTYTGTGYFLIYYEIGDGIKKKSISVNMSMKGLKRVSKSLKESGIEADVV
jgi:hypothetical protein